MHAEVSISAIQGNLAALRRSLPADVSVCAAVKADAYGHGLNVVLTALRDVGVEQIAVAHLEEAVQARRFGWTAGILCFAPFLAAAEGRERHELAASAIDADVAVTVLSAAEARLLGEQAGRFGRTARVEVKVDSGMGRMGVPVVEAVDLIGQVVAIPGVRLEGVYTHLATADEPDLTFAVEQLDVFADLRDRLRAGGIRVPCYHAANSAAVFRLPAAHLNRVRPGLALYGYWCGPPAERPAGLRPVMKLVARLTAVRNLPAGVTVGYGRTFRTSRPTVTGIVPVGYADGYRRLLSNRGCMILDACRGYGRRLVPVIGRVSMDQTVIDLTDAGDVRPGDRVILIDDDPAAPNSVESLAAVLGTIPYEITCLIGYRVRRLAVP